MSLREYLQDRKRVFRDLLVMGMLINLFLCIYNGYMSVRDRTYWFGSFSAYYFILALLRIALVVCLGKGKAGKGMRIAGGIGIFFISVVLGTTVDLVMRTGVSKVYDGWFIYFMAAYTFTRLTIALVRLIQSHKQRDLLTRTARDVNFTDALVSLFFFQTAMLHHFSPEAPLFNARFNRITGTVICLLIFFMAVGMLLRKHPDKDEK